MSITPIAPALPTPSGDLTTGGAGPAAAGFAALVAGLLAGAPAGGTPSAEPVGTAGQAGLVDAAAGEPADRAEEPGSTDAPAVDGSVPPPVAGAELGAAPPAGVMAVVPLGWQPPVAPAPDVPAGGGLTDAPAATTTGAVAGSAAGTADGAGGDEAATPGSGTDPQAAVAPTTSPATGPAATPAEQPGSPVAASSVPPAAAAAVTTGPATSTSATPAESSGAASPASPVTQVVPEVTRLVSRGNGVHRLTMRLEPEALGEVRVTLTVRDGAVQVRLTGGDDAARALAEGAPELRRVLELAGASEARVVVRDLAGQPAATPAGSQGGAGHQASTTDLSYDARSGAQGDAPSTGGDAGQQDQHARTRGGAGARDGLPDGATVLRPDPVTDARQGIDLTM